MLLYDAQDRLRHNRSALCCCEYFNNQEERSHLCGCCCNCVDFDESVDRLVVCERVPYARLTGIVSTCKDRFRIPWRGGAKQIAIDSALPIFILPVITCIASQSLTCTLIVFLSLFISMCYLYRKLLRFLPRTKFFVVWSVTSLILILLVFELNVVPLLEILPEENCVLVGLVVAALCCAHKVRVNAILNHVAHADTLETSTELTCSVCRKRIPPRTFHCVTCQSCIIKRDHHCVWLDCCIGERNHLLFVMSLLLSVCGLTYGAILTLTSVCHPFFFLNTFLLPDDCSDVYHDFEIALCFVSAIYCLLLALLLLLMLIHQCWIISLGVTGQEWRMMPKNCLGFGTERFYSKGILSNWGRFFCCRREVY